jgi:hypothetical protein
MTSLASRAPLPAGDSGGVAVTTVSSDDLRATVRVAGSLSVGTCPVLLRVLDAHLRAGRKYLRVDLDACAVDGADVLEPLSSAHAAVSARGGMLVFDHADGRASEVLRRGDLFISTRP